MSSSGATSAPKSHIEDYRPDIDGLRAIAVLAVIAFHAAPTKLPGGYIGVDIFFVISGFLISGIIFRQCERGRFSLAEFYARRIKRIFPALIVVLTAAAVFGWFFVVPDEYDRMGRHTTAGALFVSNLAFWMESGYFDNAAETKPLLHLWSLGVEEQFYIFWPLIAFALYRYLRAWLVPAVLVLIAVSFALNVARIGDDAAGTFFLPHTRFWELLAGAVLAYLALQRRSIAPAATPGPAFRYDVLAGSGLVVLAACMALFHPDLRFPGWWALAPTLATLAVIHGSAHSQRVGAALSNRLLVGVGLISYPLYLWHLPPITFLRTTSIGDATATAKALAIVVSFVLAWLTYQYVERPIRFGLRAPAGRIALSLGAAMSAVAMTGVVIASADGFPARYPEHLRALFGNSTQARSQHESAVRVGRCFLEPDQGPEKFAAECLDPGKKAARGGVLLWGDSLAAHLAPGLNALWHERDFRFMQLTASGCPPMLGYEVRAKPNCRAINERVRDLVQRERPTTVILAGGWSSHPADGLPSTVRMLRDSGVTRVVLVGPPPAWRMPLPKLIVFEALRRDDQTIPERMTRGLGPRSEQVDRQLRELAARLQIDYVSPYQTLCDERGCLVRLGDRFEDLIAHDNLHFTAAGSNWIVARMFGAHDANAVRIATRP